MKRNQNNPACITIEPGSPEYRQLLTVAIKYRDIETLELLKGNTHKTIRFVMQWFLWSLMTQDHDQSEYVTIYSIEVRQNIDKFQHHLNSLYSDEGNKTYKATPLTVLENLYDFLQ